MDNGIQNLQELESLNVSWVWGIEGCSPIFAFPNLQRVRVSSDMEEALASIEGAAYGFELEIEQEG